MPSLINLLLVIIPSLAAIAAFWNAWAIIKYSRINVMNSLQNFMLEKAKDCNVLWKYHNGVQLSFVYTDYTSNDNFPIPVLSEIIISKQLLDNSLESLYRIESLKKRSFLLKQFWIQLDTSLRTAIIERKNKENNITESRRTFDLQFQDIIKTFKPMF
ncbi:MAG TPA: hypothetical protein VK622_00320 [Puia sp.]|nr:hypothetical protein [Puia sp.]